MSTPSFTFQPFLSPALPIEGRTERFPVHRIYCIGRNYGKHVVEMGGDPKDQPPVFFMKPADAAFFPDKTAPYPSSTANLHHEVELVAALSAGGTDIAPEAALDLVLGYAVGIDLTRRDLQNTAKDKGQPWDAAKGFDASAPMSAIRPKERCGPLTGAVQLTVNGALKQNGRLSDMIWTVPDVISQLSKFWTLQAGDLIFTGTPDGVGPLLRGDHVEASIEDVGAFSFKVV